jgi:anti-anti-sigma regulatory factor
MVLEGELGLRDAADLAQTLATTLADGGAAIDATQLHSIDAAILQVLIAGHRTAAQTGVPFGFSDPEQPVLRRALVGHGMIAADGSPLTPEHDFWTRPVTPGAVTPLESEAA